MKIAHVSDIHIRNLKYHDEYRRVFENLYRKLDELRPDIVINTGDTAHTKTQISPEFVEMCSEHVRRVSEYAPYHIILGNHDMNLMNPDRQDAITPVVESIANPRIFLHKKSGLVWSCEFDAGRVNLWTFSMADPKNYPQSADWAKHADEINIGLFHGSIRTCITDSNWRMTNTEHDLDIFEGLDYVFLGDIHKQQFFRNRKIAYAGSLIQQNFGEETNKGFLLWNIRGKEDHDVQSIELNGSRKFYTVRLDEDLLVPDMHIEDGSRIRISPPKQMTLVQQKDVEKFIRRRYKPHDVITLSPTNISTQSALVGKKVVDFDNLRQLGAQERLIRNFLKQDNIDPTILEKVLELNRRFQVHIEQRDDVSRNITWKINKIVWSNLFNFGENNVLDFSAIGGLTGLFAPNASGKSNFVDVLLETCFDDTTKGISKNIFLINDNKESASVIAELTANDQNYVIERTIERVKYGQKNLDHVKEWGKTTCNFYLVDEHGAKEPLVGMSRPETERNIRQRLGSFEDFMLTSLSAQWNMLDLIACKETDRKKILFKFLDLDIFEQKCLLAKDENKEYIKRLRDLEESGLEEHVSSYRKQIEKYKTSIANIETRIATNKAEIVKLDDEILSLTSQRRTVEIDIDIKNTFSKIEFIKQEVAILNNKIKDLNNELTEINTEITKLDRLEQKFDLALYEKKVNDIVVIDEKLLGLHQDFVAKCQTTDMHKKNISLLREVPCGDQYPRCKFLVDAFESKSTISILRNDLEKIEHDCTTLKEERAELSKFKEKLDLYRKFVGEKETLKTKCVNINLKLENHILKIKSFEVDKDKALADIERYKCAEDNIARNQEIDKEISIKKRRKVEFESNITQLQNELTELTRLMGSDQGVLEKINTQLDQLKEIRDCCTAYEHYIHAMGKDGIAYQILTQKLPLINDEINKILSNAADFNVMIEHDSNEQSIRLYIQYDQYKPRLLELGSGAEKMLASVAIRTALLNISNLPKTNMFIIDEGFGKLDPKNLESINKIFDYLRAMFDHVIIISHVDHMKDMVDNIIDITTDENGYAHIDIGG